MSNVFVNTQTGREVISMCGGTVHSCFVFDDKRMKCVGSKIAWGLSGAIADTYGASANDLGDNLPYVSIGTDIGVEKVACSTFHICMKLDTGDMKCLGDNAIAQIGIGVPSTTVKIGQVSGHIGDTLPVVNLGTGFKVADIALGAYCSCALSTGGLVKCFGYNEYGQLGQGDKANRGDSLSQMGDNLPNINLGTGYLASLIHIGIASFHVCAIISSPSISAGRIKCWGFDNYSQLGYGGTPNYRGDAANEMGDNLPLVDLGTESRVAQLASGTYSTCALLITSRVKCWGRQNHGEFSIGSAAPTGSAMGNSLQESITETNKKVKYLGAGKDHICIIYDEVTPTMKCTGINNNGQLGQGDKTDRGGALSTTFPNFQNIQFGNTKNITMMMVGGDHNCVAFEDLRVKCFGYNEQGQLALGDANSRADAANEMGDSLPFISLYSPSRAPTKNPTVPTKSPTYPPSGFPAPSIISFCTGHYHTCAVFEDMDVKCGGRETSFGTSLTTTDYRGDNGAELGNGLPYLSIASAPSAKEVYCGGYHTCFKLDSDDMKCVGENIHGQIGIGSSIGVIGSSVGFSGNALPFVSLGTGFKVAGASLGTFHTCVLSSEGTVKCYGNNSYGQLGLGNTATKGTSASDMGDNLPYVSLGTSTTASAIYSGTFHNCVILASSSSNPGRVKCWGYNQVYHLGYGTGGNLGGNRGDAANEMGDNLPLVNLGTESRVKQLALGDTHTCAILYTNGLKCWGSGSNGQLGQGSTSDISSTGNSLPFVLVDSGNKIQYLTSGSAHICIAYDDLIRMKCIGSNNKGQLGLGDTTNRGGSYPTIIPTFASINLGTNNLQIKSIHGGYYHNCILFVDSSVKCFGSNEQGQLIIGNTLNVGDAISEMGPALQSIQFFAPIQSPTARPTKNPSFLPTKNPTNNPTTPPTSPTLPTKSPTTPSTQTPTSTPPPFAAKNTSLPQVVQIAVGVSVSILGVVGSLALFLYCRKRNKAKAIELKEKQSSPTSALSIGRV